MVRTQQLRCLDLGLLSGLGTKVSKPRGSAKKKKGGGRGGRQCSHVTEMKRMD